MNSSDMQRIIHMKGYCEDIARAIQRFGPDFEIFKSDTDYLNSISMSIMQIGELSVGLSDEFKQATKDEMQWGMMRGMRNMYAHAYAKMDKLSIWETAIDDIPTLQRFCEKVIGREPEKRESQDDDERSILRKLANAEKEAAERNAARGHHPQEKEKDRER